jgi:hypothetical protein|nr:MAG TPA: hypothetical protein [Caudoviricetes sp.]
MIDGGHLIWRPGSRLNSPIFNFLDGKNWRDEMRVKHVYPKSKTILPQPPVHVKLYFNQDEWEEIREHFLLDKEHNNPEKTVRIVGGTD